MSFQAVKDALILRDILAQVRGLAYRVKEPLVRFDFANMVQNGGFDAGVTGWTPWNSGLLSTVSGELRVTVASGKAYGSAATQAALVKGARYAAKMSFTKETSTSISFWADDNIMSGNDYLDLSSTNASGEIGGFFTSKSEKAYLSAIAFGADKYAHFDNASLWEADPADDAPWLRLPYGYSVSKTGMIVRDGLILHPSEYTEISRDGQTFIKPLVAPGHDTEFSIWAGVNA
ncbi:hypothetical protein [Sulfitobacter dubius]|uniref:Uncharacterized protein n=1 Tax=Sulfitobacter dubius TaxID=218673 RepID=A0ABY3ZIN4_9RHOB|nr:hypothetical protein [Sulfitobacter dubius]UOA14539.1 hypothetical protein DSM109990_01345 [Sulfitobacter dubius]